MNSLFEKFQEAYSLHYDELSSEGEQDKEDQRYDTKEKSLLQFRKQVTSGITQTENHLSDQVDCLSDGSRVSKASSRYRAASTASSTASARAKEKAKVAKLLAERAMLKKESSCFRPHKRNLS